MQEAAYKALRISRKVTYWLIDMAMGNNKREQIPADLKTLGNFYSRLSPQTTTITFISGM